MPDVDQVKLGGTMRLGIHQTKFVQDSEWSNLRKLYGGADAVYERHRHRYEVNPLLIDDIEKRGLKFIGKDETGKRMEMIELKDHKFLLGLNITQNTCRKYWIHHDHSLVWLPLLPVY